LQRYVRSELEPAGVPQHVGMNEEGELSQRTSRRGPRIGGSQQPNEDRGARPSIWPEVLKSGR